MRGVTWKYKQATNTWEGTVKGDLQPLLFICGKLCVTDLRESHNSTTFIHPKHYKIIGLSLKEAKTLAEDLVNNVNIKKHEQNRINWLKEQEVTAKIIKNAEEFLKTLNK